MDLEAETLSASRFFNAAPAHIGFGRRCYQNEVVVGLGRVLFSQHVLANVGLISATFSWTHPPPGVPLHFCLHFIRRSMGNLYYFLMDANENGNANAICF